MGAPTTDRWYRPTARCRLSGGLRKGRLMALLSLSLALALAACQDAGDGQASFTTAEVAADRVTLAPTAMDEAATPQEAAATEPAPEPAATPEPPTPEPTATEITAAPEPTVEPTTAPAEAPVSQVTLDLVTGGLARPLYLAHAFDERLFVVEQAGQIQLIENGQLLAQPFLDISERVNSTALEQGLLSVAFHPQYQENGRFFVNYTDLSGDTVVAEFLVDGSDPNRADPGSERILLSVDQPYGNHNGGQLKFGPDGNLFVGMGDGGSAGDPLNNGQDLTTLLGALLRLDVDSGDPYGIPADNPYAGVAGAREEIWASGLRNPWRFSFDRQFEDLYIADVGQNMWEEVNFQAAGDPGGQNYGWNVLEANACYSSQGCDPSGFQAPVAEYSHQGGNCSITGGYVYRGQRYPSLSGNYFFADYCSGTIWSLFRQPDGSWLQQPVLQSGIIISSFGEDSQGELYVIDHAMGDIYRLGS
jgi:glucose/arabinose dehydrogenase